MDLLDIFNDLSREDSHAKSNEVLHAPFAYPGAKSRSLEAILPFLPYTGKYIEPFGGSGAILLAREKSSFEVFNDRFAGVVAFYQCIRDDEKYKALIARLDLTLCAKEEFVFARDNWQNTQYDLVERAALWYTSVVFSFGSLGRNFGRATQSGNTLAPKLTSKLLLLPRIHERFRNVQVENQDWYDCMTDYDSPDAVFYCDPPYIETCGGTYKHNMTHADHRTFLDVVHHCKGFVAVSGYANPLYDECEWSHRHEWKAFVSISPRAYTETNNKLDIKDVDERAHSNEVLWIKEASK